MLFALLLSRYKVKKAMFKLPVHGVQIVMLEKAIDRRKNLTRQHFLYHILDIRNNQDLVKF